MDALIAGYSAQLGTAAKFGNDGWSSRLDGDRSMLGELIQNRFASSEFLEAGRKGKDWFSIDADVKARFISAAVGDGEDGRGMMARLEQIMQTMNKFLARGDVSDELKLAFMSDMMSSVTADYDSSGESDPFKQLGSVLAEIVSGNVECLFEQADLDSECLSEILGDFGPKMTEWITTNEISVAPDTSKEYFADLSLSADANRKRRQGMTGIVLLDDIRESRERMRAEIFERNTKWAAEAKEDAVASREVRS